MPMVAPGAPETVLLRLSSRRHDATFADAMEVLVRRQAEADAFYGALSGAAMSEDARWVQRQAFAGLLWGKQFYYYDVAAWLEGDPAAPPPPRSGDAGVTPRGRISTAPMCSRCPTPGSIPGTLPGTWRSTASRSR
jgi:hypothetical protein